MSDGDDFGPVDVPFLRWLGLLAIIGLLVIACAILYSVSRLLLLAFGMPPLDVVRFGERFLLCVGVAFLAAFVWVQWNGWKRAALMWITDRLPVKVLQVRNHGGRPTGSRYVEWYHVATPFNLFRIHIHRFVASDPDGLHDHPWSWAASIMLLGCYLEERRDRTRRRTFGYLMGGDTFHRVVLPYDQRETWSLFIFGPYTKPWGFLRPAWTVMGAVAGFTYVPRPQSHDRFDPWPLTAPKGRELRRRDEIDEQLGIA